MITHTPESVLTPDFAQSTVRMVASYMAVPILEDLAQEALLRGVKAFQRTRVEHPSAFFVKIVRDTVCDHWRRNRVVLLPLDAIDPSRLKHVLNLEEHLDRGRRIRQVRQAWRILSRHERDLMYLFYARGFSLVQLSALSGKSVPALKMTLLRARSKIRQAVIAEASRKTRKTGCR